MFYICLLIVIIKAKLSNKSAEYPINDYFNFFGNTSKSNSSFIYIGNQLVFLELNNTTSLIYDNIEYVTYIDDVKDKEKKLQINFPSESQNICYICVCNINKTDCNLNICIINNTIYKSYGESILIKYDYLSYLIILFGFIVTIYGPQHYLFGLMAHITLFLYYFTKDLVELYHQFSDDSVPYYLLTASFISGIVFLFFFNFNSDDNLENRTIQTIYGGIFGFFLFKNIFYYIIIFSTPGRTVYSIFLFIFLILGIGGGYFFSYLQNLERFFYIICSIIPGTFYIIKGIGYIVGGYYSDIIFIKYKDYFSERKHFGMNGNYKKKIVLYICLQIFIILSSFCYQVYITKYILIVNFDSKSSSKNISSRQSLLNTDFSDKEMESSQNLQYNSLNNTEMNNNNATINNSGTEGDESNDINDQED